MDLCISEIHLRNPPWRLRNKLIASHLEKNKSVIDIGGGAANLLNYYTPSNYLCLDGMPIPEVNLVIDLNSDYQTQVPAGWDYAVNSGILEYVNRTDEFLFKQKNLASEYIFTWYPDKLMGRMSFDRIEAIIKENYEIQYSVPWGAQKLYKCTPL